MINLDSKHMLLNAASYANGYSPFINWGKSIGYRPNALRYGERNSYYNIAEDFLLNSYTIRSDIENHASLEQYATDADLTMLSMMDNRDYGSFKQINLPDSIPLHFSLGNAILKRRSVKTYTGDHVTLRHVSTVLRAANGIASNILVNSRLGNQVSVNLRTISSAGGLYPINVYIVSLNVHQLNKAIYEYSPNHDVLYQIGDEIQVQQLLQSYAVSDDDISISRANYVILLSANIWKSMRKYGNKGLRFVFHEMGAMSQNIHLATVALGLGSVDCAAYYENEFNHILGLDGVNQSILHTVISGIFE